MKRNVWLLEIPIFSSPPHFDEAVLPRYARFILPVTLAILAGFVQIDRASAQSACGQLGVDCSHHSSSAPSSSVNMNTVIGQQVIGSFLQMLFSSDDGAAAQKQLMMAELEKRKAEALRLNQIEEAKRLEAICNRLEASLKLYGVPDLKMKSASSSGNLQLKLGDGSSSGGHAGIRGLPGIALNDTTGNGGTTPYGIPGLPGIYTNGPGSGSGSATPNDPVLSLKTGDGGATPAPPVPSPTDIPAQPALTGAGITDPRNMTPQQLADMATKIESLPPAAQQRLMDAAANAAKGNPAAGGAAAPPQPPAPVASGQPAAPAQPAATASAQPVAAQLQQIAGASRAATTAATPEGAAALARTGFDTPAAGTPIPGSAAPVALPPTTGTPQVQLSATASPGSATPHGTSTMARLALHSIPPPLPPGIAPAPPGAPATASNQRGPDAASGACPHGFEKAIPTRQQLQTELAVRRAHLKSLQNTIMRFNRTIQLDQQQYAVWEDEATTAKKRAWDHLFSIFRNATFDSFVDRNEAIFEGTKSLEEQGIGKMTDFDRQQWSWLKRAKELKSFSDFKEWALSNKDKSEMLDEGIRQWGALMPLNVEIQSYLRCYEDLIDNAYDITDMLVTMDNVDRLDHNTAQYPEIVRRNGERMKALVTRIGEIERQLNGTPVLPSGTPACVAVKSSGH